MGKFDSKSDEGMLLGYSNNSRAYRVYNNCTRIVMESINVVVDDACSEGKIGGVCIEFEQLEVNLVKVTEPKEASILDLSQTSNELVVSTKDSTSDNEAKLPKEL